MCSPTLLELTIPELKRLFYVGVLFLMLLNNPAPAGVAYGRSDMMWNELSGVQILEGPDAVFAFVEVEKVIDHTSLLSKLESRHPSTRIVSQSLIMIDGKGNKVEIPIVLSGDEEGPSINPNLSRIFVFKGDIFLLRFLSDPDPPTIYKLQKDRFVRVREGDAGEMTKTICSNRNTRLLKDREAVLDDLTKGSRWRYIGSEDRSEYVCSRHKLVIKLVVDDRKNTLPRVRYVVSESLSAEKPWTKTLIEIDVRVRKVKDAEGGRKGDKKAGQGTRKRDRSAIDKTRKGDGGEEKGTELILSDCIQY